MFKEESLKDEMAVAGDDSETDESAVLWEAIAPELVDRVTDAAPHEYSSS